MRKQKLLNLWAAYCLLMALAMGTTFSALCNSLFRGPDQFGTRCQLLIVTVAYLANLYTQIELISSLTHCRNLCYVIKFCLFPVSVHAFFGLTPTSSAQLKSQPVIEQRVPPILLRRDD